MITTLLQATIDFSGQAPASLPGASTSFGDWISRILGAIIAVAALLVLVYLIWGAISWITSGGDSAKTQKARDMMTQAVLGLIVLAASTAIFMFVQTFLGLDVLRFPASKTGGNIDSPGAAVEPLPKAPVTGGAIPGGNTTQPSLVGPLNSSN